MQIQTFAPRSNIYLTALKIAYSNKNEHSNSVVSKEMNAYPSFCPSSNT